MQPLKNLLKNSEKPALHEKLELIQSEVSRRDDTFFCFIMNQTMNKNANGAITVNLYWCSLNFVTLLVVGINFRFSWDITLKNLPFSPLTKLVYILITYVLLTPQERIWPGGVLGLEEVELWAIGRSWKDLK